jgi:hypothetical protein
MKKLLVPILLLATGAAGPAAPPAPVQRIFDRVDAVRSKPADLAIYSLDWEPTLVAANKRAAKEGRPILLIVVLNSFGNIASGHC